MQKDVWSGIQGEGGKRLFFSFRTFNTMDTRTFNRLYACLALMLISSTASFCQLSVSFKTGNYPLLPISSDARHTAETQYRFYQTDHTLSFEEIESLKVNGITILYALHNHLYWVRVTRIPEESVVRHLFDINPAYKISIEINDRSQTHRLRLSIAPGMKPEEIQEWADQQEIKLLDTRAAAFGFIDAEVPGVAIEQVIQTQWISFIGSIPKDEEIQYRAHQAERGWGLTSTLTRGLNGTGMTVGIGDGGRLGLHDDLKRSIIDLSSFALSNHATQVSGIITGAGLIDPFFGKGYAPKANIILRNFSDILWDAPQYINDFGLSLTNNSYGAALDNCTYFGDYDGSSSALDAMVIAYPQLLHVFAAANSGGMTCNPYPSQFATLAGGYQPAKNVLTVGAININDTNAGFSSRGPADDGRLKPEVVAYGAARFSTINNHQYSSNSGTSFSSPATTGVATLLYERYRQLHSDSLPDAALIKNVICNAADEMGTTGPDYTFGFGRINGVRAVEILESGRYTSMNVQHGSTLTKTVTIPAGVGMIDVMLMWSDPASAPFETVTLVNDLDLVVVNPTGDTLKPWKLNYTPAGVATAAGTGADHINNYEQVTISTTVSGVYTIVVKGYNVPMGPQKAWLSWDIALAGITVQSPIGGEVFKPGNASVANDRQYIRWDAFGTGTSTFNVDYKTNGGSAWTSIATNLPADRRYMDWFPPDVPTDQLKVRVTASNGMIDSSDQNAIIMSAPGNLTASSPCNGYIQMSWNAVSGANAYQIYTIKNEVLSSLETTSSTSLLLKDFPYDSAIWVTVSGVLPSGSKGLRARAIQVTANGGNNCSWNHDLRIDSLVNMSSGRMLTTSALSAMEPITVRITNAGTVDATGFSVSYSVNNNTPFVQTFPGTLNAGTGQDFTFSKLANMAAQGTYDVKVWLTYPSDPLNQNDTTSRVVVQLTNPVLTLPWIENFENCPDTTLITNAIGISTLDAWDAQLQLNARLRTYAGAPFNHGGTRSLTVDAIRSGSTKNENLIVTLNMSSYAVMDDDIRLNLYAMHHEIFPDVSNTEAIWIRGTDTDPFVLLTYIANDASTRGTWQYLSDLNLTSALDNAGQDFSSSFQIKFTHGVYASAGQLNSEDGQTIDDISIYRVQRDIKVSEILHPDLISCGLGMETIQVEVTNTSALVVNGTTVYYQLNGGPIYSTVVGTVAANTSIPVFLSPQADFSAPGTYQLKVWAYSADDDFHFNDTTRIQILHTPLVDTYPYTEGFEQGDGGWVSGGINSTWMHGVPGKQVMSRAAEGNNVWTTSLDGTYHADEISYMYSPCFDLVGLAQPYLSFGLQFQLEVGYDYAWVEYRVGGSSTWNKLGTQGSGVNWYNHASNSWNGDRLSWLTTGIAIPVTNTTVQFRWVLQSDVGLEMEGLAIDQVHVYDRKPLYTGANMQWTIPVSGNDWIHIDQGGQRVFSIHPSGQDLGDVTLKIFKSNNAFHLSDSAYLLSRNWVLTSSNPLNGPIKLRGYFTKEEAANLVAATGCAQCTPARDGFDVTALRYTGANEDGDFSNDIPSQVTGYPLDSTSIVPYDNGYYAEWSTTGLSEWWITSTVTKWSGAFERKISSAYDDAEEHQDNGSVNPVREILSLTTLDGQQKIGWRFKNITIPKGSYISSARLKWISADTSSSVASWTLQSELSTDASSFITSKYNISSRPRSNQVVQWMPSSWNVEDNAYFSPDIKHLIQQVTDQAAWKNGNDLVLMMRGTGLRTAWSYDGDPLKGAELILTYDSTCISSGICFVDINATGLQDGSTWTNAYRSLEQALDRASHCTEISAIWIADGTYTPFSEVSRSTGYSVPPGVNVYGGFQGNETDINQRVPGAYPTILSGDIGVGMVAGDNLYHVITIQPGMDGVLLDGLTIRDGLANGGTIDLQRGSGIYNPGILTAKNVVIQNCSSPALYNSPGAVLTTINMLEVKQ